MFACIYFKEDATLSVVSDKDKDLRVVTSFDVKMNVEMAWRKPGKPKEVFHGVIVKTGDDEQSLVKFATKAYSSLIKGKVHSGNDVPEEIFDFQAGTKKSQAKRERVKTDRLLASERQEMELSPKKRKTASDKLPEEKTKQKNSAVTKTLKVPKTVAQTPSINAGKLMFKLFSEFTGEQLPQVVNSEEPESLEEHESETAQVDMSELVQRGESQLNLNYHTTEENKSESSMPNTIEPPTMTPLSNTWQACQTAMMAVQEDQTTIPKITAPSPEVLQTLQSITAPSPEVLQTLQSICNPDFIAFVQNILQHVNNPQGCQHPCLQFSSPFATDCQTYPHLSYMNMMELDTSHLEPFRCSDDTSTGQFHLLEAQPAATSTPAKPISIQDTPPKSNYSIPSGNEQKRRTPKTKDQTQSDPSDMVRLLESSTLMVDRGLKRKACNAAKAKNGKEGYILMYRLCGAVFTVEEMANSRGQGIGHKKANEDTSRPVIDPAKIKVLKDYCVTWCKAEGRKVPQEAELNTAVTERISYARKQNRT